MVRESSEKIFLCSLYYSGWKIGVTVVFKLLGILKARILKILKSSIIFLVQVGIKEIYDISAKQGSTNIFSFLQMVKSVKNILNTKKVLNIQNHNERSPHNLIVTLLNEKNRTELQLRTFTTFIESFNLTKAGTTQLKTILY